MHEELVKVTNELYTVSKTARSLTPRLITELIQTSASSLCLYGIFFRFLFCLSSHFPTHYIHYHFKHFSLLLYFWLLKCSKEIVVVNVVYFENQVFTSVDTIHSSWRWCWNLRETGGWSRIDFVFISIKLPSAGLLLKLLPKTHFRMWCITKEETHLTVWLVSPMNIFFAGISKWWR